MARKTKKGGFVMITVVSPPETANCTKDLQGNLRYNVSLFADDDGKPVNMLVFRRSKEEYVHAIEAAGLKILEVSDKNLDELKKLGAIEEKTAKKFDIPSRKVRVNLSILARKP